MGGKSTKEEPPKPSNKCEGCEKEASNADELYNYIGKKYCKDCIGAIKQNNRRTMNSIKKVSSSASADAGPSSASPTSVTVDV